MYKQMQGDLIELALRGHFDVITHGCNCFCKQGAGIARSMAEVFRTNDPERYTLEHPYRRGDYSKQIMLKILFPW